MKIFLFAGHEFKNWMSKFKWSPAAEVLEQNTSHFRNVSHHHGNFNYYPATNLQHVIEQNPYDNNSYNNNNVTGKSLPLNGEHEIRILIFIC